jgi:hypothetical protein
VNALLDLAARCEAATGPDIYLDADIRDALGLGHDYRADWRGWGYDERGVGIEKPKAFPYTASLEAAMSLVPEGVSFAVGRGIETELGDSATDYAWCGSKSEPHKGPYCWAATPAAALCAAALKAKASMEAASA